MSKSFQFSDDEWIRESFIRLLKAPMGEISFNIKI